jgi:hypothetical protein
MLLDSHYLKTHINFESKFVRVGNEVYITEPNDLKTLHRELAERDKVYERIEFFKAQDKDMIDGGLIFVGSKTIQIGSASSSLSIPETNKARRETVKKIKDMYPEFSVKELVAE